MELNEAMECVESMLVAFPDLEETARFNSPDLGATHRMWADLFCRITREEFNLIIARWHERGGPDRADSKRPAHALIAEVFCLRDRAAKSANKASRVREYQQLPGTPYTDANLADVFRRWRPIHKDFIEGAITEKQYADRKKKFLDEVK